MANRNNLVFEVKSAEDDGSFKGILSTYGNVDMAGDICIKGCFARDIATRGSRRPLLWQHDKHSPIGSYEITDSETALNIAGRFNLGVSLGREAHALVKAGDITGLSIGYVVEECDYDSEGHRLLKDVTLYEGSVVTFPCNTDATITSVKEDEDMDARDELKESIEELTKRLKACEEQLEKLTQKADDEEVEATEGEEKEDSEDTETSGNDEEEKALSLALEHLTNALKH